jgi:hypothetical protein
VRRAAVADLLAVEEHRRFVLLTFPDDHSAVHRHRTEDVMHSVDGRLIRGDLVALANEVGGGECRILGYTDQLKCQIAVGPSVIGQGSVVHGPGS